MIRQLLKVGADLSKLTKYWLELLLNVHDSKSGFELLVIFKTAGASLFAPSVAVFPVNTKPIILFLGLVKSMPL